MLVARHGTIPPLVVATTSLAIAGAGNAWDWPAGNLDSGGEDNHLVWVAVFACVAVGAVGEDKLLLWETLRD